MMFTKDRKSALSYLDWKRLLAFLLLSLLLAACQSNNGEQVSTEATSESAAGEATAPTTAAPEATEAPAPAIEGPTSNADWQQEITEREGVRMAKVPAGCFTMGAEGIDRAEPAHQTCITKSYWIDVTEVSNAQFERLGGEAQRESSFPGQDISAPEMPRTSITWEEAAAFCQLREARLPTEAEWEYAARGPESWPYPWGDQFDPTRLNFCEQNCQLASSEDGPYATADDGFAVAAPVDSLPEGASWVGALHMAGNAAEWVADYYDPDYYANAPGEDPSGPESGTVHIVKSGTWAWHMDPALHFQSANRFDFIPEGTSRPFSGTTGFRCVQPAS